MNIKTSNQIYQHPDGHAIELLDGMLTVTDSDGQTVSVPIGEIGLSELGERMVSISQALTTMRSAVEQEGKFTSERAGAVMGNDLVDELLVLRGRPQAEAFRALHDKLLALSKLEHFDSAAGGFAGAVVNVLEVGVANLPKFKRESKC